MTKKEKAYELFKLALNGVMLGLTLALICVSIEKLSEDGTDESEE